MSKYTVYVSREWVQCGEVTVDSENEYDAETLAYDMLIDDDSRIQWMNGNNCVDNSSISMDMDRGDVFVQGVESSQQ